MLHTRKHLLIMKATTTFHENCSCRMFHLDPCLIKLYSFSAARHYNFAVHIQVFHFKRNPFTTNQVQRAKRISEVCSATYQFQEKFSEISWTSLLCFLQSEKLEVQYLCHNTYSLLLAFYFHCFLFKLYATNCFHVMINF